MEQSLIEYSHRESVSNARWLQSKSGTEFFSGAMDGQIVWWDTKKLTEPVEKFVLDLEKKERIQYAQGITKLEYDFSIVRKEQTRYSSWPRVCFVYSQRNSWWEQK